MGFPAWGFNTNDIDHAGQAGRRLLRLCQRQVDGGNADPAKYPHMAFTRNLTIVAEQAVREIIADAIKANAAPGHARARIAAAYQAFWTPTRSTLPASPRRSPI